MVDKDGTSRMTYYICETCGVQLDDSKEPPSACPICTDERQFVGWEGQRWTTLEKMRRRRFKNRVKRVRRGLHQIITEPPFAICQRAFLVETGSGNLLLGLHQLPGRKDDISNRGVGRNRLHRDISSSLLLIHRRVERHIRRGAGVHTRIGQNVGAEEGSKDHVLEG